MQKSEIVVIYDEKTADLGRALVATIEKNTLECSHFLAQADRIKPCYSCVGCETKTFGKCVFRDDMDTILPMMAVAETWVILTPVIWGGPSYTIKKVIDKSALLGNRFYRVRNKELVKGANAPVQKIVFIGISNQPNLEETKDFVFWGNEVGNIMDIESDIKIMEPEWTQEDINQIINTYINHSDKRQVTS